MESQPTNFGTPRTVAGVLERSEVSAIVELERPGCPRQRYGKALSRGRDCAQSAGFPSRRSLVCLEIVSFL